MVEFTQTVCLSALPPGVWGWSFFDAGHLIPGYCIAWRQGSDAQHLLAQNYVQAMQSKHGSNSCAGF